MGTLSMALPFPQVQSWCERSATARDSSVDNDVTRGPLQTFLSSRPMRPLRDGGCAGRTRAPVDPASRVERPRPGPRFQAFFRSPSRNGSQHRCQRLAPCLMAHRQVSSSAPATPVSVTLAAPCRETDFTLPAVARVLLPRTPLFGYVRAPELTALCN